MPEGLPDTFKTVSPFPFGTMNRQASRLGMADPEAYWIENFVKVGDGTLTLVGAPETNHPAPEVFNLIFGRKRLAGFRVV